MRKLKRAWNSLAHSANAGACSPPPESAAGERRRQGLLLLRGNAKHAPESRRVAGERRMKWFRSAARPRGVNASNEKTLA
jgi:hypothetical protein